jgi:ATP-dependent DNA helicase RecG
MDFVAKELNSPTAFINMLAKNVSDIDGIGEKTAEILKKNQIISIFDLLLHVPKSIVQQEMCPGFCFMEPGRHYVAKGLVLATKVYSTSKKRRLEAVLQDKTGRISIIFFGPAVNYAQQILKEDEIIIFAGEAKKFLNHIQMTHPRLITDTTTELEVNIVNYSQLGGLNSATFKRIIEKALFLLQKQNDDKAFDHFPINLCQANKMANLKEALLTIHKPNGSLVSNWDQRGKCLYFRRLAFEELLSFYLRLNLSRKIEPKKKNSQALPVFNLDTLLKDFFSFSLTKAQLRTIEEIIVDLHKPVAMARLLQGDVGSGKTAVSAVIALYVATAGKQIAVMAPTEILAEQLFKVYSALFEKKNIRSALLTASTKTKERKIITDKLAAQKIDILIGTHALLSEDIKFKNLGLLIIDEQHRFGVKQRAELLNNCAKLQGFHPHLLVMSATPIPRSLALTFYGDLELSVIDERPPGRIPIHTQIFFGPVLKTVEKLCERIIATKQKTFIVFPLVEESEKLDLENASKALIFLQEKFGTQSALLIHGKMKHDEKSLAMAKFKDGDISLLVATTVVEVGVDVPDATCMIIVHPERFGLAQLHQLRGRVGRKDLKSFCFLVTDLENKFKTSYKRLKAMCKTDNGFKLAEIDLKLRGPGEIFGTKQSGLPTFRVFNHSDFADLISLAKKQANNIVTSGLNNKHLHLYLNNQEYFS